MVGRDYIHSLITHSLTHSFNKYSLPFCCVLHTELRVENIPGKAWYLSSLNFQFHRGALLVFN